MSSTSSPSRATWEDLRKQARSLDPKISEKLAEFTRLAAGIASSDKKVHHHGSKRSDHKSSTNSSSNSSSTNFYSIDVAQDLIKEYDKQFITLEKDIASLLTQVRPNFSVDGSFFLLISLAFLVGPYS
jgi:hypothetical protein